MGLEVRDGRLTGRVIPPLVNARRKAELVVRDGAGGTVLWRLRLGDAGLDLKPVVFDPPLKASAATLLEVAMLAAVTGAVYVNASGFIAD